MVRTRGAEEGDHPGQRRFGAQAHVQWLHRQPNCVEQDHFSNSRTKPAEAPSARTGYAMPPVTEPSLVQAGFDGRLCSLQGRRGRRLELVRLHGHEPRRLPPDHPRPCKRLARGPCGPNVGRRHHPEYLCEMNAVPVNTLRGTKRPKVETQQGKTPARRRPRGAPAAEHPRLVNVEGQTRPRSSLGIPTPRPAARGDLPVQSERHSGVARCRSFARARQVREAPLCIAAPCHRWAAGRTLHRGRAQGPAERPTVPAGRLGAPRPAWSGHHACRGLQVRTGLCRRSAYRHAGLWAPQPQAHRGDQRPRPQGRHRRGTRVARSCQREDAKAVADCVVGSIPAPAGQPGRMLSPIPRIWVHCRASGAACLSRALGAAAQGPSPRERGSQLFI